MLGAVLGLGLVFLEKLGEAFSEAIEAIVEFGAWLFRRQKKAASVTYNAPVLPVTEVVDNEVASDVPWANREPLKSQIALCKRLGVNIPAGATRQEVSAALDRHFVEGIK
jgi:hypothetical protein